MFGLEKTKTIGRCPSGSEMEWKKEKREEREM